MSSDDHVSHIPVTYAATRGFAFSVSLVAIVICVACGGGPSAINSGNGGSGGGGGGGQGPVAASVSGTIPVGTTPVGITVDSTNNKVYVADHGSGPPASPPCSTGADVMVIDGATQSTTAAGFPLSLPTSTPTYLAFNSVSHTVDVAAIEYGLDSSGTGCRNDFDDVVSVDPSNPSAAGFIYHAGVLRTATLGAIAADQNSGDIYLGRGFSEEGASYSDIAVLDDTGTLKADISAGTLPLGIAVNPNPSTSTVYVGTSDIFGFPVPSLLVIDKATNTVTSTLTFPAAGVITVAVNPTTNTIYAANEQSNNVSVIDAATDTVTATIAVGNSPTSIAVNEQTNFIYVANSGFQHANDPGSVTVIDGKTNATTTLTDPNALFPSVVAVNPVTNKIYVTNSGSNNVTVINGASD